MDALYHIGIKNAPHAKYAILPGDPGRVEVIATYLDNPTFINSNREFTTYLGTLNGVNVLVTSTGIGGPSTAIAVEELYKAGVRTFIRVGTCGGMQTEVVGGDLVIATAAARAEGTSKEYMPIEYPAVASYDVVSALVKTARETGRTHHIGVIQSKDSFYGQHSPERMPVGYDLKNKWSAYLKAGCLASEMECAALFTVSSVLGARSGAVLSVFWNQERVKSGMTNPEIFDSTDAILTAVNAIKILIENDK